jgi:tetratricopeptide (TPR) repeat protein
MPMSILARWRADRDYFRACRLARSGAPAEAAKVFDQVIQAVPNHTRAYLQRALALAAAGRTAEAVKAARRAAELAPKSHAAQLFLGQIHYDAGNLDEARKAFTAAARLDPQNQLVQAYLGLTMLAQGQMEKGAEVLQRTLRYGYERLEGRVIALAEAYLWEHRDQARPLEAQLTAEEGGRDDAPAGVWLRSASLFRTVLLAPLARLRGPKAALTLRAREAMSIGDAETAIAALKEAAQAGADPLETAFGLGQAYYDARQPKAAVEQLSHLPEDERRDPDVASLYGGALFEVGRYDEAREYLAIAAARFRQEFVPAYYRGMCDIALGHPKAATHWFVETASRLNPHVAEKRLEEMIRVSAPGTRHSGTATAASRKPGVESGPSS